MDGGRVFRALMTPRIGRLRATYIASRVGRTMAILFGLYGLWHLDFILIAIAFFIHNAAGAGVPDGAGPGGPSRRRAGPRLLVRRPARPPRPPEITDEVVVSPPPYARHQAPRRTRSLFDDLFEEFDQR